MPRNILPALQSRGITFWSKEEDTILKEKFGVCFDKDLAKIINRSVWAICARRKTLGLTRGTVTKKCPVCGRPFRTIRRRGKFCSAKCRARSYRLEWSLGQLRMNEKRTITAEKYVAEILLPRYDFTDILWTRPLSTTFPIDIIAKKDGILCGIEVTEIPQRAIRRRLRPLLKYLFARIYVCHILNSDYYVLNQLKKDCWYSSSLKSHPKQRGYTKSFVTIGHSNLYNYK